MLKLSKSKEYYEKICLELNIRQEETCMIGDNTTYDIFPADLAGLNTIFLNRYITSKDEKERLPSKTIICDSYEQVLERLSQMNKI